MPQAVGKYVETKNLFKVDEVKRRILRIYEKDIAHIPDRFREKTGLVFSLIPAFLSEKNKTFSPGKIAEGTRTRDYFESVHWLSESKTVNICYGVTDPEPSLILFTKPTEFKCYMADTGLLISQLSANDSETSEDIYRAFTFDRIPLNQGMIFENMVAQELVRAGHRAAFCTFHCSGSEKLYEVDFLINYGKKPIPSK